MHLEAALCGLTEQEQQEHMSLRRKGCGGGRRGIVGGMDLIKTLYACVKFLIEKNKIKITLKEQRYMLSLLDAVKNNLFLLSTLALDTKF